MLRHNAVTNCIFIIMKFVKEIKRYFDDILDSLRTYKWRAIICAVICALGIALGIVLYNISNENWWCANRCAYAELLYLGEFKSFFSFLAAATLFVTLLTLCNMTQICKILSCLVLFVFSLYVGANSVAVIACYGVFGILCVICVLIVDIVGYFFATFCCMLQQCGECSFRRAFCGIRQSVYIILMCFCVKIVSFFVILRIITAFI